MSVFLNQINKNDFLKTKEELITAIINLDCKQSRADCIFLFLTNLRPFLLVRKGLF